MCVQTWQVIPGVGWYITYRVEISEAFVDRASAKCTTTQLQRITASTQVRACLRQQGKKNLLCVGLPCIHAQISEIGSASQSHRQPRQVRPPQNAPSNLSPASLRPKRSELLRRTRTSSAVDRTEPIKMKGFALRCSH